MKQLTQEVFKRPDCPEWAKSANVSKDGVATWWEATAEQVNRAFSSSLNTRVLTRTKRIGDGYNAENYSSSAISREV